MARVRSRMNEPLETLFLRNSSDFRGPAPPRENVIGTRRYLISRNFIIRLESLYVEVLSIYRKTVRVLNVTMWNGDVRWFNTIWERERSKFSLPTSTFNGYYVCRRSEISHILFLFSDLFRMDV